MKRKISAIILAAALAVQMFSSCTSLDIAPTKNLREDQVFDNEVGVTAALASLYSLIPIAAHNASLWGGIQGDAGSPFSIWNNPGMVTGETQCTPLRVALTQKTCNGGMLSWWDYSSVRYANLVLKGLEDNAEAFADRKELYNHWLGEAYFCRAFMYFAMVRSYGGVPIVTTPESYVGKDAEALFKPRNTCEECYDFIAEDLRKAYDLMGDNELNGGRANKYIAAGILSRVMLTAASEAKYGSVQLDGLVGIPSSEAKTYYMLAYAFQVLHEQGYKNVATEEFDNVAELLAAILCRGVSVQIKRGLIRQYISREEALASPRGKLEIGESIKTQVIRKKQLVCNYDEFSVDAYPNRIIKTTMELLLRGSISKARKKEIRKLMIFFDGISILDIHSINWDIQYDRNNQTYRMLIAVCRFVIKGLLQTTADGSTKIMDYADDQTMAKLYEKFILGYYQREHPELKAYSPQIAWQVTDGYRTLLPTMQSDIVITNKAAKKTLIIDAKYYTHNMQMKAPYMTQTLHSGNLYQIFTYVKNWSAAPDEVVSGMLLYAGTDDAIQPNNDYQMSGNQISVKTLDMDCDFSKIAAQLDSIADRIK